MVEKFTQEMDVPLRLPVVAILAGGLATRLRPKIVRIPKALVEVAEQPFLIHLLALLRRKGISRIVMCVGHLGDQIVNLVGDGHVFGLEVEYSFDGPKLLGTGGALKKAAPQLDENFFVLNGDTYLDCNYRAAYRAFLTSRKDGLMTVFRNENRGEPSNVLFSDGNILCYDKVNRVPDMQYIDCGLAVLKRKALDYIPEGKMYGLGELFQVLLKKGQMSGYEVRRRYFEIGSHQGINETSEYLELKSAALDKVQSG